MQMRLIVNCGPCGPFIKKCLASIQSQTVTDWEALVTIDPYDDQAYERAREVAQQDRRIQVFRNPERLYWIANAVHAVQRSGAAADDVFVSLDGDDWFYTDRALEIIRQTYAEHDCWLTYGSWISNLDWEKPSGSWPAYPDGLTDFRGHRWLATQVKTWKKWLWDLIDDQDLRDARGTYHAETGDKFVMFPMLEMCGTQRARHIPDILMLYNHNYPQRVTPEQVSLKERLDRQIRQMPPYRRLDHEPPLNASVSQTHQR